jgi:lysozyme
MTMKTNRAGIALIKRFEGLVDGDNQTPSLDPYICPTGYVTTGYGHVLRDGEGQPYTGKAGLEKARAAFQPITEEQAESLLQADLEKYESAVTQLTRGIDLNENQFSALVSFVFNIGPTAFGKSTMLKLLSRNDFASAEAEFARWVKGDTNGDGIKETLPGLIIRREAERKLFVTPPPKPLSRSRTLWGGVTAAVSTTGLLATELAAELTKLNSSFATTGLELDIIKWCLAVVTIIGSLTTIYARVDDRLKLGK